MEKNLIQSMFRLKNDNFQSLNAFKKRIKRNDTFSKNKLSLNNLNKKSNDKGILSNFPTKINFEHRNFNSLNYLWEKKKILSLSNSLKASFQNLLEKTPPNKFNGKIYQTEGKNNLMSLTRNRTISNFQEKKKNYTHEKKRKKLIPPLLEYKNNSLNKTFYKDKNLSYKNSNSFNLLKQNSERGNLYNKINIEKYVKSETKTKIKIIKRLRLGQQYVFHHHQKFLNIINKKRNDFKEFLKTDLNSYFLINSSREDNNKSNKIIYNDNKIKKPNNSEDFNLINASKIKFSNSLIKKFINKRKFKKFHDLKKLNKQ